MDRLIGKSCKIVFEIKDKLYFYTVKEILSVTDTHITFKDKYESIFVYNIKDIHMIHKISN